MKSICVISDTHGRIEKIRELLPIINSCEHLVFLGDYTSDVYRLKNEITTDVIAVRGNCDFTSPYPDEQVLEWCGYRFFITHGHRYHVKSELLTLTYAAKENNCSYALFGHTHESCEEENDGVMLINPGSLAEPRFDRPSYCMISFDKGIIFTKIISM